MNDLWIVNLSFCRTCVNCEKEGPHKRLSDAKWSLMFLAKSGYNPDDPHDSRDLLSDEQLCCLTNAVVFVFGLLCPIFSRLSPVSQTQQRSPISKAL